MHIDCGPIMSGQKFSDVGRLLHDCAFFQIHFQIRVFVFVGSSDQLPWDSNRTINKSMQLARVMKIKVRRYFVSGIVPVLISQENYIR